MNSLTDILILASFLAGLIPAAILLVLHGTRTDWYSTTAGRLVFSLIAVIVGTYTLTVLTLVFPDTFHNDPGEWLRIVGRLFMAVVLWNLLKLFLRAQRDRRD